MMVWVEDQIKKETDFYDEKKMKYDLIDFSQKHRKRLEQRYSWECEDRLSYAFFTPMEYCSARLKEIFGLKAKKGSACDWILKIAMNYFYSSGVLQLNYTEVMSNQFKYLMEFV